MAARVQYYHLDSGWFWRLLGANNRTLAYGPQPHADRAAAVVEARAVFRLAAGAQFDLFDEGREWHWAMLVAGRIRAVSANRFGRRLDCLRAVRQFRKAAALAGQAEPELEPGETPVTPSLPG
ncbi:MAG: hypothetical protein U0Q19_15070 [Kineosporiaceae bacterium]|jgi:hypothetical protein